jgi:hypothetical protein
MFRPERYKEMEDAIIKSFEVNNIQINKCRG